MIKQQCVLIVCRSNITPETLQALQIIIPLLSQAAPFHLATSSNSDPIEGDDPYSKLVQIFAQHDNDALLSETLRDILRRKADKKYRVCVLGGKKISWDVALEFKRKKVIIDTIGIEPLLSEVSHTTGGLNLTADSPNKLIKHILNHISMSTAIRKYYPTTESKTIVYHLTPICCERQERPNTTVKQISNVFAACSVCMAVYCRDHSKQPVCLRCEIIMDKPQIRNSNEQLRLFPIG